MREEEFLKQKDLLLKSIKNNTTEYWKNYYKDAPVECIYEDLVIDINEIKRLTEENRQLQQKINEAIGNWNTLKKHFEFLKINTTGGNKEFMEDILKLMNILEGGENNR